MKKIQKVKYKYNYNYRKESNMKFDLVVSNPPYNGNIDIKILRDIIHISDEWVVIHPSTWLIDNKNKFKLYNTFRDQVNGHVRSSEMFNGNRIFGISLSVPITITHIDMTYDGDISVNYFRDEFSVSDIYDVTKFGSAWFDIVKPFIQSVWGEEWTQ